MTRESDDEKVRALVDRSFFMAKQETLEAEAGVVEYCIVLYLLPVLNPTSYDGARVLWRPRAVLC